MNYLILTVDYEVFGNGSGSVSSCILRPAKRMMNIADRYNAPITFFAEALELHFMEKCLGDVLAKEQLKSALKRGHDVQLHIHPQWHDAKHCGGRWHLDFSAWRIGDLPNEQARLLIEKGKQWLEEVAANLKGYSCMAFRAGGWCIQRSSAIVQLLVELGFQVDSTVAPGYWNPARGEWSDFRSFPSLPWWRVSSDVCGESKDGSLIEVPIATGSIARLRHLTAVKRHRAVNGGLAEGCVGNYHGPGGSTGRMKTILARLFRLGRVMLDFSTMPADVLISVTEQWMERFSSFSRPVPIVAIAHTKNFTADSERNLSNYLAWAKDAGLQFSTYGEWLEAIHE